MWPNKLVQFQHLEIHKLQIFERGFLSALKWIQAQIRTIRFTNELCFITRKLGPSAPASSPSSLPSSSHLWPYSSMRSFPNLRWSGSGRMATFSSFVSASYNPSIPFAISFGTSTTSMGTNLTFHHKMNDNFLRNREIVYSLYESIVMTESEFIHCSK